MFGALPIIWINTEHPVTGESARTLSIEAQHKISGAEGRRSVQYLTCMVLMRTRARVTSVYTFIFARWNVKERNYAALRKAKNRVRLENLIKTGALLEIWQAVARAFIFFRSRLRGDSGGGHGRFCSNFLHYFTWEAEFVALCEEMENACSFSVWLLGCKRRTRGYKCNSIIYFETEAKDFQEKPLLCPHQRYIECHVEFLLLCALWRLCHQLRNDYIFIYIFQKMSFS